MVSNSRAATLSYYLRLLHENESIPDDVKAAFNTGIQAIAEQFYKAGVKAGYVKILLDHRDGKVSLNGSTPTQINELIAEAQVGDLMPGRDIPRIVRP